MVNGPGFFKFYIPEFNADILKIPPAFICSIQGTLPENVVLRDRYKNLWLVKLEKIGDDWYFNDGWLKFIHDNMIKGGDMLVFDCFSKHLFDFKIFGASGCEEKGVGCHKYKIKEEQEKLIESDDDTDGSDYVPTTREENQPDECPRGGQKADGRTRTGARGSNRNCDWYGGDIFGSGKVPQPTNPYFVTKIRRNRSFELYVPMDIVKAYNLQLPEKIMLVDPTGKEFAAKRTIWKDGRVVYKGGWKRLCAVNMVEIDDRCICEFIQPEGEKVYLSISFFRGKKQQG